MAGTGKTGRRVVQTLRTAGQQVRPPRGPVRCGSTGRSGPPGAGPGGVSAVYLLAPEDPALAADFVAQAVDSGVGRFVALSGRGIDQVGAFSPAWSPPRRRCGSPASSGRSSGRTTSVRTSARTCFANPCSTVGWLCRWTTPGAVRRRPGHRRRGRDAPDVTGHHEQVYDLSGPHALTFAAAVATIATASGRSMRYVELTPEQYQAELLAAGYPEDVATALNVLFAGMRAGHLAEPADGVRRVLGRDPLDFDSYAARAAAAGAWS
ncbi:hypothetical protein NKG94_06205 [Micromonospora sp. M12]